MIYGDHLGLVDLLEKNGFTLIDEHTRISWVYLLKDKSETKQVIRDFNMMIQTQFHAKIKIFRSDNGKEYFNKILGKYFFGKWNNPSKFL